MTQHHICLLAYEGLCIFEFATAYEMLSGRSAQFGADWYRLSVVSLEGSPVSGPGGVSVVTEGEERLKSADTIIVPGWRLGPVPDQISMALTKAHARGTRIASICTGAFVLGAPGLLDGRRVSTHWQYVDELRRAFPRALVDGDMLYADEGDIITSAGSTAGVDMILHMIRRDFGLATCNAVARSMVAPPHRDGGQAQFIERAVEPSPDAPLARVIEHIRNDLSADLSIRRMAAVAVMSPRTFFRRFRQHTGMSPHDWVLRERIRVAREQLELTDDTLEEVAFKAGFGSAELLRYHLRKTLGVTPGQFRRTFRSGVTDDQAPAH